MFGVVCVGVELADVERGPPFTLLLLGAPRPADASPCLSSARRTIGVG
ncbi:unnamed protein product [Ectocarpus sp. CCAP 1310/34]|nr:unnamed protein product [Ectocarpus sp. CCAP 1310/34]